MALNGSPISFRNGASGRGRHSVPRSLRSFCITGLISVLVGISVAAGQTSTLKDPLFGLSLPATMAQFERSDPALIARCGIGAAGSEQRSWVFAQTRAPDGEYLVLGGLARTSRGGMTGPWVQDWKGELVRVNGHGCVVIDPPREALMYPAAATVPLEQAVVDGLAADAVSRYSHAFGSRGRFIAELRRQGVYPEGMRLDALRSAIEASTLP